MSTTMPSDAQRASLFSALGCDAPWGRKDTDTAVEQVGLSDAAGERKYYASEIQRLCCHSTKREVFTASVVRAAFRHRFMRSEEGIKFLATFADCRDLPSCEASGEASPSTPALSSASFSVWRVIEKNLQRVVQLSEEMKTVTTLQAKFGKTWRGYDTTTTLRKLVSPPVSVSVSATPAPLTPSTSLSPSLVVDVHSKVASVQRYALDRVAFVEEDTLLRLSKEALQATAASRRLEAFLIEREALFDRFGLRAADDAFSSAELRESDRSRVDGREMETRSVTVGIAQIASLVYRNVQRLPTEPSEEARSMPFVRQLSEEEFRQFFYASLSSCWSSIHEKVLLQVSTASSELSEVVIDQRAEGGNGKKVKRGAIGGFENGTVISAARQAFHDRCVAAGLPHYVLLSSSKYRCGSVAGELDVVVFEMTMKRVRLVVETKFSPADLVKAREQMRRLQNAVTSSKESVHCSGIATEFSTNDDGLTVSLAATADSRKRQRSRDDGILPEATTPNNDDEATDASSRETPSSSPLSSDKTFTAATTTTTTTTAIRMTREAFVDALACPLAGTTLCPAFAFCTSLDAAERKSPYYSAIAHIVLRELSNELGLALISCHIDDEEVGSSLPPRRWWGPEFVAALHVDPHTSSSFAMVVNLVWTLLCDEAVIADVMEKVNTERITSAVRRAWNAEANKGATEATTTTTTQSIESSSSSMRLPQELWRELQATNFETLILV